MLWPGRLVVVVVASGKICLHVLMHTWGYSKSGYGQRNLIILIVTWWLGRASTSWNVLARSEFYLFEFMARHRSNLANGIIKLRLQEIGKLSGNEICLQYHRHGVTENWVMREI